MATDRNTAQDVVLNHDCLSSLQAQEQDELKPAPTEQRGFSHAQSDGPDRLIANPSDPFHPAMPNLGLHYKLFVGEPLSEAEQAAWDAYQEEAEAAESRRELIGLVDLAEVMREGTTDPDMLVTGEIVRGEHHLVFGTKESAKTWLALRWAAVVMAQGETVIWVDKEMGRKNLADRLLTLSVSADVVEEYFVYCEYPTMDGTPESRALWNVLLEQRQPALMVVDAQTEVLADANLNENIGTDIEKWTKWYVTPLRRRGCTTVMLDHTGHDSSGRAVASRQKGAAAKVELEVVKMTPFGRDSVGLVEVTRRKNTVSAPIPDKQHFRIGGSDGGFIFETTEAPTAHGNGKANGQAATLLRIRADLASCIKQHCAGVDGLSQNQMRGMVQGNTTAIGKALASLAADPSSGVDAKPVGNGVRYFWRPLPVPESE